MNDGWPAQMKASDYKILLVDDEPGIIEFLKYNLEKEGYSVISGNNGLEAVSLTQKHQPDLIILDVMMPVMDGLEACRQIRKNLGGNIPIIVFLTALGEDYSQINGLDAGADDYIIKPIKPKVFLSKIKSLLRRKKNEKDIKDIKVGELVINFENFTVTQNDREFILPKKEFELLNLLVSRPGKVFSREEILSIVWGNGVIVGDRTIDVHIRKLREKFGNSCIKTIKGFGYKFEI